MPTITNSISIVIPVLNEQDCLPELWKRLESVKDATQQYRYEFIFVDDGSIDKTLDILRDLADKNPDIKIISLSRNFGHDIAVTAGCDYSSGDIIVLMDGDLQDPPELIPDMIRLYEEGYDVVYAKRRTREGESFIKLKGAELFYWLANRLSSIKIPENTSNFRLMTRKVLEEIQKMKEQDPMIRAMVTWVGLKQKAIEFDRKPRFAGRTKYSFIKNLKLAADGIIALSNKPLYFIPLIGIIFCVLMVFSLIFALLNVSNNQIYAIVSIIVSVMFFIGAVQLFAIGIVAEYISRIHKNTRGRPLYIISEKINLQ